MPSPNLDFSNLGQVSLTGDFDAISVYQFEGQHQGFSNNGSTSILGHLPDGAYEALAYTDASIEAMCPFVLSDGTYEGIVVGGNFTSIGGVQSRSVALYNTTSRQIVPLPGIQGTVTSLLCDKDTETVYVGGSFEAGHSSNAIAWIAAGAWANLPFAGFDAPVTSITKAPNGHVIFGGSFTGLGNGNGSITTSRNLTSRATQTINLQTAQLSAGGNTTRAGLVTCPANGTAAANQSFLLRDDTPGYWQANFRFGFEPTKLRLWNTNQNGRGTKTWRFTASPIEGIMNFTYTDPESGNQRACDARCPLAQNTSTGYQDFYFVNPNVGMNSFRLDISDWYGKGGGLAGIELFQSDIFSYAIDDFNEPTCTSDGVVSSVSTTGNWYTVPSRSSVADYLTTVVGPTSINSSKIVFEPNINESGNYTVLVYTPGCMQDSSCSARAMVNVSGTLTTDAEQSFSTQVFQTNNFDKYDQVFQGHIDAATGSFRPQVTISASGLQPDQLIVASRIQFGYISSTGGLNGLFDFDPNKAEVDTDFSKSAINSAGTKLQPGARISSLAIKDDAIYAAGSFSDDEFENILCFENNNATSLPGGGLNAAVRSLYSLEDLLYVGGNFSGTNSGNTAGLNNAAAYAYESKSWVSLGAGLNGPVDRVVPIMVNVSSGDVEEMIAFSGSFTQIKATDSERAVDVKGLAIWTPSKKDWMLRLDISQQKISGQLTAATTTPNNTWLGAGTLASLGQSISGAVGMQDNGGGVVLRNLNLEINPANQGGNNQKRALSLQQNITGVTSGAYYNEGKQNVSIFGGSFSASTPSGSTVNNLLFLNNTNTKPTLTGLPEGVDSNSTFNALVVQSNVLIAGGAVSGQINKEQVEGLVLYDMNIANYRSTQPAALVGESVVVNAVAVRPGTSGAYVGGAFDSTSQDLSCPSVCMYDLDANQWNVVGSGLGGEVGTLYWQDKNKLLAGGNMTISGSQVYLAEYDAKKQTWTAVPDVTIPGAVSAFAASKNNGMWVAGTASNASTFVMQIEGDTARPIVGALAAGTNVRGLQLMPLTKSHEKTPSLNDNEVLLMTGQLNITGFGMASAALYNGTIVQPLVLASKSDGSAGSISQAVFSQPYSSGKNRKFILFESYFTNTNFIQIRVIQQALSSS